jgi:glycosyltransferase involved in cell wall biosynthesis
MKVVSVLILTKNEKQDLPVFLRSLAWSNDIVVFDSCSADCTQDIAISSGARLITSPSQDLSGVDDCNEGFHRSQCASSESTRPFLTLRPPSAIPRPRRRRAVCPGGRDHLITP